MLDTSIFLGKYNTACLFTIIIGKIICFYRDMKIEFEINGNVINKTLNTCCDCL